MRRVLCPKSLRPQALCLLSLMLSLVLSLMPALLPAAHAETFAVVDTTRILTESAPAKAGEAHMLKVQDVLQKTLDDLQAVYKGKENTPTAQKVLREASKTLDKQYALESQAMRQVLHAAMEKAVKGWRSKNKKYHAIINKQMLLDSDASMDVTPAILQEMEKQSVTFAELPAVRLHLPEKAPTPPTKPAVKQSTKATAKQPTKAVINTPAQPAPKPAAKQPAPQ